jgi:dihydroorotase-like cyclic amidohydrolase
MVDDETLFRTMEVAARTGALVMVHAENGDAIDVLVKEALGAGHTEPRWHALTRPPETEGEATNRAIQLAHVAGAPLYVVHVSCLESVEPIAAARLKGWDVWGETCTQIPNGGPGLENRLQMIHHFGVRGGKISLNRMVELLATNPAKLFGLYPRKGTIAVGSDADLVIFDPEKRVTIAAAGQHSRIDYNLYEGTEVVGTPETVLLRGNVLVEDGELVASPGIGRYVARAKFGKELAPSGREVVA